MTYILRPQCDVRKALDELGVPWQYEDMKTFPYEGNLVRVEPLKPPLGLIYGVKMIHGTVETNL